MVEAIGLIFLGLVMLGGALFRRFHPSWGSAWQYALYGFGVLLLGVVLLVVDLAW